MEFPDFFGAEAIQSHKPPSLKTPQHPNPLTHSQLRSNFRNLIGKMSPGLVILSERERKKIKEEKRETGEFSWLSECRAQRAGPGTSPAVSRPADPDRGCGSTCAPGTLNGDSPKKPPGRGVVTAGGGSEVTG